MPLYTKVRWKVGLFFLFLSIQATHGSAPKCDKTPLGQSPYKTAGDNGFGVAVAGSPTLYRPGQTYTVSLSGLRVSDGGIEPAKIKFIDFMLVAESHLSAIDVPNLGILQLMPGEAMTKFSHRCSHAVKATSAIPKDEVKVLWTAPEAGNGCIQLKAMVVERKDLWYMDDGALTYTFCEDDSPMESPPLVKPCCACDEAKYEVIFEGLWSRHTHPKDYPADEWKTQFSHMIGASHSIEYDLWKYGEPASPALTMLSVTGQTRKLEIDMKRFSKHIRSVIKARGLQQRSNVVGRTFAVFRMDPTNHLLSLVSKMIPSPDWIVGVSMENLCLANCSWVDSRVVDLYPWDAGIMSGLTYNDAGDETMPVESIRRITACNPDSEISPFFDATCAPLKPVARLHILKQREYKKQCANGPANPGLLPLNPSWGNSPLSRSDVYGPGGGISGGESGSNGGGGYGGYNDYGSGQTVNDYSAYPSSYRGSSSNQDECETKSWSEWTRCSATCGPSSQSRSRVWEKPVAAAIGNCDKSDLFMKRTCPMTEPCPAKTYATPYDPLQTLHESGGDLSGYTSTWLQRGLTSGNLKKEIEPSHSQNVGAKSYLYTGSNTDQEESGYSDPYHDPYDKYSGYSKQKGYPPITNQPGSANYNPYKALGYYGYTYGGPPTGHYSNKAGAAYPPYADNLLQNELQGDSTTTSSCETGEWAHWSDCSVACGEGSRSRKRFFIGQDTSTCSDQLHQMESCQEDSGCIDNDNNEEEEEEEEEEVIVLPTPQRRRYERRGPYSARDPQCAVADWSAWSPCSVTCGLGYNIRTRVFKLSFVPNRVCEGVRLTEKQDCLVENCRWMEYYDDDTQQDIDDLQYTTDDDPVTIEIHPDEPVVKQPYCVEDPDPGRCRMEITRWYYNPLVGDCQEFKYSGCGGNRNSFIAQDACMEACHFDRDAGVFKDLMPMSLVREDYIAPAPTNCQVTEWSVWSECSVSCGKGWATRTRSVLAPPQHGGRACPRKLEKRKKCRGDNCPTPVNSWYQGNWKMLQDN